ncbi:hypothetical protein [Pedococcus bigeumensis]|uniref:Uncharacterized protein n=1 Tax=Pedococcus bigeumensis TaxID=433644 RepID=A0A502CWY7_9MICO|nr:hypothetical protein [Pedococcus bigeumensis]TPG17050.1 hypothetical protein EAH86_09750 [Pedococcus bigeumensis]
MNSDGHQTQAEESNAVAKGVNRVERGRTLTEQQRPRVLLIGAAFKELAGRLGEILPTVGHVGHVADANLKEWDCILTVEYPATIAQAPKKGDGRQTPDITEWKWRQEFNSHLSIVLVQTAWDGGKVVECWPPSATRKAMPDYALMTSTRVVGRHLTEVKGLSDTLEDLVKQHLVPAAKRREDHFGLEPRSGPGFKAGDVPVRPFLLGPDDLILAGSYERSDKASVWVLPSDLPDLLPWIVAALREWHDVDPERFPALPDWHDADQWRSAEEVRLRADLDQFEQTLKADVARLLAQRQEHRDALDEAKARANAFERALLTEQGTPLEEAVAKALTVIGFEVREMDREAEPGKFKEDYRITDPDAPGWIALGEAKGFTKGVSEVGMQSLSRWAGFFIKETGDFPTARWYIANHMVRQDPSTRPEPLHGRDDVIEVFAADNGLVLDTRALFALVRDAQENPEHRGAIRAWLRGQAGVITAAKVDAWLIGEASSPPV